MFLQAFTFIVSMFGALIGFFLGIELMPNLTLGGLFGGMFVVGLLITIIIRLSGLAEIPVPSGAINVRSVTRKKSNSKKGKVK